MKAVKNLRTHKNGPTDSEPVIESARTSYFQKYLAEFSGHCSDHFCSFDNFTQWLHTPTDAATLSVFRILFGLCMLLDIPEERGGGNLDIRFGEKRHCHFPLFNFIQPFSLPIMGVIYMIMWMGALGIMLGYRFRMSCLLFLVPYSYVFLLDKPAWNNHSYLYGLCAMLLLFTDAHKYCSLDSKHLPQNDQMVPYWNYFLVKFQFFILYFVAGLKKMSLEWLSGYSMTNLGYHWVFIPFRMIMSVELIELLIIHWFTAVFDLTIAFWLTYERTRIAATPFVISFHLMNSRLFTIGMFPWVCLAELPLFYSFDLPRKIQSKILTTSFIPKVSTDKSSISSKESKSLVLTKCCKDTKSSGPKTASTLTQKLRVTIILSYCALQLFLPYSHFITKGYNNWTNGLYGYSWDMMVHAYDTLSASVKIFDNNSGQEHYLEPYAFTEYDRWTKHADMAKQYAQCIEKHLVKEFQEYPSSLLTSNNISIYFDIWCSMNGRFQQRVFDPRVDILRAKWSPFENTEWVLPLLKELNHMRPLLRAKTEDVLAWSNHSDCLFIADHPELALENFISNELVNVTMTVLQGEVQYETLNMDYEASCPLTVGQGQRIRVESGVLHRVTTLSKTPSCYMYTFINQTMVNLNLSIDHTINRRTLPLADELRNRYENYKYFFYHVGNSLLFLIYGVPMPIRIREHS